MLAEVGDERATMFQNCRFVGKLTTTQRSYCLLAAVVDLFWGYGFYGFHRITYPFALFSCPSLY